ncbi:hypothetical protein ACPW96_14120 [Micromonospora sp. DT81.3]|uniref:hypothetical protein n=1 Tax=Micromonospora sp. DT81.3 TaxID=3416523 RepID=UPI003CF09D13
MKKMFLLGAGASIDAGLWSSVQLTKVIASRLQQGSARGAVAQLLHAVVGAMIQHESGNGGDAFETPDVENVFAAVRTLKQRDDSDLSAFVQSWSRSLDAATGPSGLRHSWGRDFREALNGERAGDSELQSSFEQGVLALTELRAWELFHDLERQMLRALVEVLQVDEAKVAYLEPMICADDLHAVATLNYDLSVETASRRAQLSIDTGLDNWTGGGPTT